jgi:DNA-binding SARP family transcriptional activator
MSTLKLFLLGPPHLEQDGIPVEIGRRKAVALISYLAVTRQRHHRDALAAMFWPESDQRRARASLRRVLSDLTRSLQEPWLDTTGETVALRRRPGLWIDVEAFRELFEACQAHKHLPDEPCQACFPRLIKAAALYGDDFMAGFTLPDSPAFDEWQFFQTEGLRQAFSGVLERLIRHHVDRGDFEGAIPCARRWVALDPLLERPHHTLMQLYAWGGQWSAALRQYQAYARILDEELSLSPGREITALYERIRRDSLQQEGRHAVFTPPFPAVRALNAQVEGEIRPVTVLCVGYSSTPVADWQRFPEQVADEASTLLRIVREAAWEFEAQVERLAGDRVQALFGVPRIHEDDPERAIRAAGEIQDRATRHKLNVAIGVSTGRIYWGTLAQPAADASQGLASAARKSAVGPIVHLAARLQDKAQPGQTLVSQATWRHTRRAFEFRSTIVDIVGMAEPVTAYQVVRALPHPEKARGIEGLRSELIGREKELHGLRVALGRVLHGQGQVVLLTGEAGLGKTRLIEELRRIAGVDREGETGTGPSSYGVWAYGGVGEGELLWLEGRCIEWRTATGYWPFIDMVQACLRQAGDSGTLAEALVSLLKEMIRQGDLPESRLDEIGALLGNLLSIRFGNEWDKWLKNASPEQIRHQTFVALYDFLVALSRRQCLVLVFEDVHWADDLSLDLMSLLMEAVASAPILLLCVYRPQRHVDQRLIAHASKCPNRYTALQLQALAPEQSRSLVASLLSSPSLPPVVEEVVLTRSQGNPFFAEEVLRALIDSGVLDRVEGEWRVRSEVDAYAVPQSVQSVILSRVDRLRPALRDLLRRAAVIGHLFSAQVLALIAPRALDLEQALWALEEAALIYRERIVPEVEYSFRHVLIQETIYQTLSGRQRARLHGQIAEALEQRYPHDLEAQYEQLAYHYGHSTRSEKAVEYLIRAGEKSSHAYLTDKVIQYFQQALERCEKATESSDPALASDRAWSDWRLRALTGLGEIHHRLGRDDKAEAYLRRAVALGEKASIARHRLVRLYHWLAETLFWQGQTEEAIRLGKAGLDLLPGREGESVEAVLMNQAIAICHLARGKLDLFQAATDRTAQFIRRLPYSEELRSAYLHIFLGLYYNKRVAQAQQWLQVLERLAEQHHDLRALAEVYDYRGEHRLQRGDLREAIAHSERALHLYTRIGAQGHTWRSHVNAAWAYLMLGDLPAAEKLAGEAHAMAESLGLGLACLDSYLVPGLVYLCQRSWEKAEAAFQAAMASAPGVDFGWTRWTVPYGLGRLYLAQGKKRAALHHFQQAMDWIDLNVPVGWQRCPWWPPLACVLSGLEAASESAEAYRAFCRRKRRDISEASRARPIASPLPGQWHLEPVPVEPPPPLASCFADPFCESLSPGWTWHDPGSDCSFHVQDGLEIRAAGGRDLWHINHSAPRLLRQACDDFVVQTVCAPRSDQGSDAVPSIGGLVIWKDRENYVRLVWGLRGARDVAFEGCVDNEDIVFGRGFLPAGEMAPGSSHRRVFLRLERQGHQVKAFCSAEGRQWFSVGQGCLPACDPVQVGLHAVGWIDRTVYLGAHADGAAIRFAAFEMWC